MIILHRIYPPLTFLLSFVVVPFFLIFKRGRARLFERFGVWDIDTATLQGQSELGLVWFHGASLGEVKGLLPVIRAYRKRNPEVAVLVTATSVSAFPVVEDIADAVHLLPFDCPVWINRVFRKVRPAIFVCGEIEIWPALYMALSSRGVPILLANARMSLSTFRSYLQLKPFFSPLLDMISRVLASESRSAERFVDLGMRSDKVSVVGNSKYDQSPSISSAEDAAAIRSNYFTNDYPVVVLGSIWPGEEEIWFPAIKERIVSGAQLNFVVAPRHAERFEYFSQQLQKFGIPFLKRSSASPANGAKDVSNQVLLLDVFGELEPAYAIASLAFIGGSIREKVGGHNPLEAAAYRVPIAMGKHREVVEEICEVLKEAPGLFEIVSRQDALEVLMLLEEKPEVLKAYGEAAYTVWQSYSGATERIVAEIEEVFATIMADSSSSDRLNEHRRVENRT